MTFREIESALVEARNEERWDDALALIVQADAIEKSRGESQWWPIVRAGIRTSIATALFPTFSERLDAACEIVEAADAAYAANLDSKELRKAYEGSKKEYRTIEHEAFAAGFHWNCGRCNKTGRWPGNGGVCFNCGGSGFHPNQTAHKFEASPHVRAKREAAHRAKVQAEDDAFEALLTGIGGDVEARLREVVAEFDRLGGYYNGTEEMDKDAMFSHGIAMKLKRWGSLSPAQIGAVQRGVDRKKARAAEAETLKSVEALAEGRYEIEGEVLSVKSGENDYGFWTKMLVKMDDGNKVYGSVPNDLHAIECGGGTRCVNRGERVRFAAKVERSKDDEHFGFYSRPTKAALVEEAVKV